MRVVTPPPTPTRQRRVVGRGQPQRARSASKRGSSRNGSHFESTVSALDTDRVPSRPHAGCYEDAHVRLTTTVRTTLETRKTPVSKIACGMRP